jgi:hypothetical protein
MIRRFLWPKNAWMAKLGILGPNQQRTHHKVGTTWPPKVVHTAIYAEGTCPYTHRATHNHHTECVGLPWWSFGSTLARTTCRGSPVRFETFREMFSHGRRRPR